MFTFYLCCFALEFCKVSSVKEQMIWMKSDKIAWQNVKNRTKKLLFWIFIVLSSYIVKHLLLDHPQTFDCDSYQRWSRGHKARGQGQEPRTQAQVFSKKKKKNRSSKIFFQAISKKKGRQNFFQAFSNKERLLKFFFWQSTNISTIQKKVLSSSRGQANFRGLDLRGQGQGLQNVSSRTPPLITTAFRV